MTDLSHKSLGALPDFTMFEEGEKLDLLRVTRTVRAVVGRRPKSVELHGLEERE